MAENIDAPKKRGRKPKTVEVVEPKKRGRKPKVQAESKATLTKPKRTPEAVKPISIPPVPADVINNTITTGIDSLKDNVQDVVDNTKKLFTKEKVEADERGWDVPEKDIKFTTGENPYNFELEHYPYRDECFYEKVEPLIIPALIAGTFLNTLIIVTKIFCKNK